MRETLVQQATTRFYEWEILGRGWLLCDTAIDLEPPFTPFFGHIPSQAVSIDDGLHHTFLSKISGLFKKKELPYYSPNVSISYGPISTEVPDELAFFQLHIPRDYHASNAEAAQFLAMLTFCTVPISFEFIATNETIWMQCTARARHANYLYAQLQACFPRLGVSTGSRDLLSRLEEGKAFAVTDFGLEEEFMRPLACGRAGSADTLTSLFSILNHLEPGEEAVVQILFNGVVNRWERSIHASVTTSKGEPFFMDAPEMLPLTREKIDTPLVAVSMRMLTMANNVDDAMLVLQKAEFAIRSISNSSGNALIPLPHPSYTIEQRLDDILLRQAHRTGMLLNLKELATFVHIPQVHAPKLWGRARRTKAAPEKTIGHSLELGVNEHQGRRIVATLPSSHRIRHTHIIGATGTGKSTLLRTMMVQDIEQGNGLAVLDPHGDLIESILSAIPPSRMNDVILVDPADDAFPLACNILFAHSAIEKEVLSSDLVAAFRKSSTSWGDQMNSVFANAISAFLESKEGGTLADVRRFLIEKNYRESFLKTVKDPSVNYYWQKEYPLLKTNSVGPILTRLDTFLRPRIIRNMVCQRRGLNFEQILDSQKILLIKLSQGLIGAENSQLLGSLFVSKIHQASFARQGKDNRPDFFLYIDEFHHFLMPSMEEILSGGRKYHLGLILAHQNMQQLQKYDNTLIGAIAGNVGTQICFRVGETDAKKLAEGFSFFKSADLQNLDVGEAIARIDRPEFDFSLSTYADKYNLQHSLEHQILALSRSQYCTPKAIVEEELANRLNPSDDVQPKILEKNSAIPHYPTLEMQPSIPKQKSIPTETSTGVREELVKQKEETQHRYLQTLIKKMAESRGYRAAIEASTPDGRGKVDVLLEGNKTIACEISVTTDANWELHNIQKCVSAGYDLIISCLPEASMKASFQRLVSKEFSETDFQKIKVMTPEELFSLLDEISAIPSGLESVYKGYRVKVQYDTLSADEMSRKREAVARVVVDAMKRMKK